MHSYGFDPGGGTVGPGDPCCGEPGAGADPRPLRISTTAAMMTRIAKMIPMSTESPVPEVSEKPLEDDVTVIVSCAVTLWPRASVMTNVTVYVPADP